MRWRGALVGALLFALGCEQILFGPTNRDALDCAYAPVELDPDIVRVCVLRASCPSRDPLYSISECIELSVPTSTAYDRCTLAATTCDDIEACFASTPSRQQRADATCDSSAFLPFGCDGDVWTLCLEQDKGISYDCALAGGYCVTGGCKRPGCEESGIPKCDEACLDDGTLQWCLHEYPQTLNCADYGFTACEVEEEMFVEARHRCR
jgi:hypothetical protein